MNIVTNNTDSEYLAVSDFLHSAPELTVVVPTFNELGNVKELVACLDSALQAVRWEVIFVDDDSPDGTAETVRSIALSDPRVRCVHRIGRRGLSSACIEGFLASSAPYLAVIDGDLQHDERVLPQMLDLLRNDASIDIIVGTRYADGGGIGDWDKSRASMSRFATKLSQFVLHAKLSDPMSGFFMVRRRVVEAEVRKLSGIGFKLLLDIFASAPSSLNFREVPFTFRLRRHGESKLDSQVAWEYLMLLADKKFGRYVPVRFISFALVGGSGIVVDLASFAVVTQLFGASFVTGRIAAVLIAMTSNFAINNVLTYRDRRLKGWGLLRGWLSFAAACSVGALSNVGVSNYLHSNNLSTLLSIICGIAVGVVWNYAITALYTWRSK
jgi:dolichol-phosphate mannosyltransferase